MRRAMLGAAVFVSVADGGGADMISEMLAVTQELRLARKAHPNQLVRELADVAKVRSGLLPGMSARDFEGPALEAIRSAVATVEAKAPDDAPAFTAFLVLLAETAARAHREGTFMGIGGTLVSRAEEAAIAKVRRALGVS